MDAQSCVVDDHVVSISLPQFRYIKYQTIAHECRYAAYPLALCGLHTAEFTHYAVAMPYRTFAIRCCETYSARMYVAVCVRFVEEILC
jgi:hypothetical protein